MNRAGSERGGPESAGFEANVEAGRSMDVDEPCRDVAPVRERVRNSGREEDKRAGPRSHVLAVHGKRDLPFEHEEGVVLGRMDVSLGAGAARRDRDQREVEARRVGRARQELDVADGMPLAGRDDEWLFTGLLSPAESRLPSGSNTSRSLIVPGISTTVPTRTP